jgi:Sulfotransferase domain
MHTSIFSGSLPTFFVIGPPRTGTSWLHEVLRERVQLPATLKETRFFDIHFGRGWNWYRAHYPAVSMHRVTGEIAPTYFASAQARERIVGTLGAVKVACIFREPVERIESLYRVKCAYGMTNCSFEEALLRDPELVETSRYATHLRAWQSAVGKERVLSLIYEDLCHNPQAFLDRLADFIGIERWVPALSEIRRVRASSSIMRPRNCRFTHTAIVLDNWCKCQGFHRLVAAVRNSPLSRLCLGGGPPFPPISPDTRARLYQRLRPEIDELELLLKRDLTSWKGPAPCQAAVPLQSPDDGHEVSASACCASLSNV